ncbi:hypothetical protein [Maribellus maritimus]|uniref:hypothetical protein n=1 Tax=Maribellus maritimus TaxID=2870838 RepID=UPI001EE9F070|nr:hypothetical protein [Maribellus maritimus]MCG6188221.1 hypothetical protein [Maribellus maritimus]
MKKELFLIGYNLGIWGILGFLATLLFGFLTCCANLPSKYFYGSLIAFAIMGISITTVCVTRGCKKMKKK